MKNTSDSDNHKPIAPTFRWSLSVKLPFLVRRVYDLKKFSSEQNERSRGLVDTNGSEEFFPSLQGENFA